MGGWWREEAERQGETIAFNYFLLSKGTSCYPAFLFITWKDLPFLKHLHFVHIKKWHLFWFLPKVYVTAAQFLYRLGSNLKQQSYKFQFKHLRMSPGRNYNVEVLTLRKICFNSGSYKKIAQQALTVHLCIMKQCS